MVSTGFLQGQRHMAVWLEKAERSGKHICVKEGSNTWAAHDKRLTVSAPLCCRDLTLSFMLPLLFFQFRVSLLIENINN